PCFTSSFLLAKRLFTAGNCPPSLAPIHQFGWVPHGGSWTPPTACVGSESLPSRQLGSTTPPALWTTRGHTRPYPLAMTSFVASTPAILRVWSSSIGSALTGTWRRP